MNSNQQLDGLESTIHNPVRFGILLMLYTNSTMTFKAIEKALDIQDINKLNSHVKKLTTRGYTKIERNFEVLLPRTLMHITSTGRSAFKSYLDSFRHLLENISQ